MMGWAAHFELKNEEQERAMDEAKRKSEPGSSSNAPAASRKKRVMTPGRK